MGREKNLGLEVKQPFLILGKLKVKKGKLPLTLTPFCHNHTLPDNTQQFSFMVFTTVVNYSHHCLSYGVERFLTNSMRARTMSDAQLGSQLW